MMNKMEELADRMDRVHNLMEDSGKSMEELLAYGAEYNVDCNHCTICSHCAESSLKVSRESGLFYTCTELWLKYLKGEIDA